MRRTQGYLFERELHRGAKFSYWLASREHTARRFLVALLAPGLLDHDLRDAALERLRDRAAINHPRIPKLVEIIAEGDSLGAAYEFVPGVPASEIVARAGAGLPPPLAGRIVERVARTIHQARISARWCSMAGLEPKSVIVDPTGAPHLLLSPPAELYAHLGGPGITVTRILYLSPEAIRGSPPLPQSTVFSLGVLLYELITARHPFSDERSTLQTLQRILEVDADPISDQIQIEDPLRRVLERAMSVRPEDRQVHPGELADALHAALPPAASERALLEYAAPLCPELAEPALALDDDPEPASPRDDLVAAIRADRSAIDPYLVYADWLQSFGEPRGELIVLQHRGLAAESERFLQQHPALLGELAPLLDRSLPATAPAFDAGPHFIGALTHGPLAARWHLGFIASLRIAVGKDFLAPRELERVMRGLDDLEAAQFLSELSVGTVIDQNAEWFDDAYQAIARSRLELDALFVGDLGQGHPRAIHRATGNVCSAFPNLLRLALRGGEIQLGRMIMPELRELRLYSSGLTSETLNDVAGSALPKLEHLELWFGGAPSRNAWPDRVGVLFEPGLLPSLRSLALADRETNAIAATLAVLAESDLASRLERIDLRASAVTEDVVQAVLHDRDRFPRLVEVRH